MIINHHHQQQQQQQQQYKNKPNRKSHDTKLAPLVAFDEEGDIPNPLPLDQLPGDPSELHRPCSCKKLLRILSRLFLSQLGLFLFVFLYITFGGWMFSAIESRYETRQHEQMKVKYSHGIGNIRQIVNDEFNWMLNASFELRYALWRGMIERLDQHDQTGWQVQVHSDRFDRLIDQILARMQAEQEKFIDKHDTRTDAIYNQKWTYSTAMLYSATVITTVGYGHIAPKSILGKVITCLYAMIGIPIMIMYLTNTGDLLAFIFIKYYQGMEKLIRRIFGLRRRETTKEIRISALPYGRRRLSNVPMSVTLTVLLLYIGAGALLFSYWEGWSYVDGAYFSFITFTTIGLGDLVPGKGTLTDNKNGKTIFCVVYLLFGLVLTAMCFKLMQDDLFAMKQRLFRRLGLKMTTYYHQCETEPNDTEINQN